MFEKLSHLQRRYLIIFSGLFVLIVAAATFIFYTENESHRTKNNENQGNTQKPTVSIGEPSMWQPTGMVTTPSLIITSPIGKTGTPTPSVTGSISVTPTTTKTTTKTPTPTQKGSTATPNAPYTSTPTPTPTPTQAAVHVQDTSSLSRKVLLLIFNPKNPDTGTKLTSSRGWNDPDSLTTQTASWFHVTSRNRVNYTVAERVEVDGFPVFTDGRSYNWSSYQSCLSSSSNCYKINGDWAMLDYGAMMTQYGVCSKVNSGEIDEVWMFGGPYFGFYEARLAGPGAFFYNSGPLYGTSCNKLVPIMGYNYERGMQEMVEDFGHRFESTMIKVYSNVYGENSWRQFTAHKGYTLSNGYTGIGFVHKPPNTNYDYDWGNISYISSYADEFYNNYPEQSTTNVRSVSCDSWGCNGLGYFRWMYQHMPSFQGYGPDGKRMDWWRYLIDPNYAL